MENSYQRDAGTTASTAVLVGDRLLVANVGDSRAVICRAGHGKLYSTIHGKICSTAQLTIEVQQVAS